MTHNTAQIYCALDTPDIDQALAWAARIAPVTGALKLGLEFFNAQGPQGIRRLMEASPENTDFFIDLKYHDIPNTVAGAVKALSHSILPPAYLNVHAAGGFEMMKAAKAACHPETKLLAVTILTSLSPAEIIQVGYKDQEITDHVRNMARLAQKAGLDGVVCSAHEIAMLRQECGPDFEIMVPGIRPAGSNSNDQKRIMSPQDALRAGATHLVVGRPITQASDPAQAAQEILSALA